MHRVILAIVAFVSMACASRNPPPCDFRDFAPSPDDHLIDTLPVVAARPFAGVAYSDDVVGSGPEDLDAQFEIHGTNGFRTVVAVRDGGAFKTDFPSEIHCFKPSAAGFRSAL